MWAQEGEVSRCARKSHDSAFTAFQEVSRVSAAPGSSLKFILDTKIALFTGPNWGLRGGEQGLEKDKSLSHTAQLKKLRAQALSPAAPAASFGLTSPADQYTKCTHSCKLIGGTQSRRKYLEFKGRARQ